AAVVPRDEVVVRRELGNRGERFAGLRTVPAGCVFVGDEVVETSGAERANQGGGRPILRVPGDVAVQGERVAPGTFDSASTAAKSSHVVGGFWATAGMAAASYQME